MAKIPGRLSRLAIDVGAGFLEINGIVDVSDTGELEEIDVTSHDNDQWREFLAGRNSMTYEGTLNWDNADAGQNALRTAHFARTDLTGVRFRMQTGTGFRQISATSGFVTSWSPTGPNDDAGQISFTVRPSGTITDGPQP